MKRSVMLSSRMCVTGTHSLGSTDAELALPADLYASKLQTFLSFTDAVS